MRRFGTAWGLWGLGLVACVRAERPSEYLSREDLTGYSAYEFAHTYGPFEPFRQVARFEVVRLKRVETKGCPWEEACFRFASLTGTVMKDLSWFEELLQRLKVCRVANFGAHGRPECEMGFEAEIVIPATHCEAQGAWGFDFGFNPGDYGLEIVESQIVASWTKAERDKMLGNDFRTAVYTMALGTRAAYDLEYDTYSGPEGRPLGPETRPSQAERCRVLFERGNRLRVRGPVAEWDVLGLERGKDSYGIDVKSTLYGTTMMSTAHGKHPLDLSPAEGGKEVKFRLKVRSARRPVLADVRMPERPAFNFPYKSVEVNNFKVGAACTAKEQGGSLRPEELEGLEECVTLEGVAAQVDSPAKLEAFVRQLDLCFYKARRAGKKTCNFRWEASVLVPMKQCAPDSYGFDLGLNLGDYGMQIRDSELFVNVPDDEPERLHAARARSVALAQMTPHYRHFSWASATSDARCKILSSLGLDSPTALMGKSTWKFQGRTLFGLKPAAPARFEGGTVQLYGHGIAFPLPETVVGMVLTQDKNRPARLARSVFPDIAQYEETTSSSTLSEYSRNFFLADNVQD